MFTFLWPWCGLFLLLPLVVYKLIRPVPFVQKQDALRVPFFQDFKKSFSLSIRISPKKMGYFFFGAWLFLVAAAMRPVIVGEPIFLPSKARALMMILDVSGSMGQTDFVLNQRRLSRLDAFKTLADDFLQKRQGDALGFVLFGTEPYLYIPLTTDTKSVQALLKQVDVGIAGDRTAIGDALGLALQSMKDLPTDEKVMILLSDGSANAGVLQVDKAVQIAKEMGVKVYTLGMASDVGRGSFFGYNPAADLDEDTLKMIAKETKGQYFRIKTTSNLKAVYDKLNVLEPIEQDNQFIRPIKEVFYVPLFMGMLLLFFLVGIKERTLR